MVRNSHSVFRETCRSKLKSKVSQMPPTVVLYHPHKSVILLLTFIFSAKHQTSTDVISLLKKKT